MTIITVNSQVIVKPGQMRSGLQGTVIAQHSNLEWKVQHSDNAIRIYTTRELEVVREATEEIEQESTPTVKKQRNYLMSKRFNVSEVLTTLDAISQADKDWVHDLDGRIVRGRRCSSLICDLLWNLQLGLVEQTVTGYKLAANVSAKAWDAYIKLSNMAYNYETGYTRKNFTGKQVYLTISSL